VHDRDGKVDLWMPLYLGDFLAATAGLSAEEGWAYTRLLCQMWLEHGYLDNDPPALARLAHVELGAWPGIWNRLSRFFDLADGRISQKRLLYELAQAHEKRRQRREAGKAGADGRWAGKKRPGRAAKRDAVALRSQCPLPTPLPTQGSQTVGEREDSFSSSPAPARRATGAAQGAEALLIFPTVRGKRSGASEWRFTEAVATELREGFPDLDVLAEARRARAWILAKPDRRKTAGGMMGFLVGWLGRSQNRGGARIATATASPGRARFATATALPRAPPPSGLCPFHESVGNANRLARRPDETCSECRHVAALLRRGQSTEPVPIGVLVEGGSGVT
jgi:uncharacterized protein YdaU (DUF1376 family)